MKKTLIILGCMCLGLAHAQQGRTHAQHNESNKRMGINTEKPAATLEVSKIASAGNKVQGFLLPHLDQTERNAMQKEALVNGLMIFNTSKNCIDWWDGENWKCQDGSMKDQHGATFVNPTRTGLSACLDRLDANDMYYVLKIENDDYTLGGNIDVIYRYPARELPKEQLIRDLQNLTLPAGKINIFKYNANYTSSGVFHTIYEAANGQVIGGIDTGDALILSNPQRATNEQLKLQGTSLRPFQPIQGIGNKVYTHFCTFEGH